MKTFDEQLMKFIITNDKLKMEIKLSDLVFLLKESPDNNPDDPVRVKPGCRQQFAEALVKALMDDFEVDSNDTRWGRVLEDIFDEWFCGDEEFLKYSKYD